MPQIVRFLFTTSITIALGLSIANLFWQAYNFSNNHTNENPMNQTPEMQYVLTEIDFAPISNLMGQVSNIKENIEKAVIEESQIKNTVKGIFYRSNQAQSLAIISSPNENDTVVKVGDLLDSGHTIIAIETKRLVLSINSKIESLTLPSSSKNEILSRSNRDTDADINLYEVREALMKNPLKATEHFTFQPFMFNGKFLGYRLNPGEEKNLFNNIGLEPDDVLTKINGKSVMSLKNNLDELFKQVTADELYITVKRGDSMKDIFLDFEK